MNKNKLYIKNKAKEVPFGIFDDKGSNNSYFVNCKSVITFVNEQSVP